MTYLYCLVRSSRRPALRSGGGSLPGAGALRALDGGDGLWLIVADVDEAVYSETAIARGLQDLDWVSRRAIGHEAVVERFLSARALLPMQLFTIFKTDERALAHVTRDRPRIDRILKRVEGHVEWGLRLAWNEQAARAAVEQVHRRKAPAGVGGTEYLARKRDIRDVNRRQLAEARAATTRIHRDLSAVASDAKRRTSTERAAPGSRLLLDAAYLVPAKRSSFFQNALRRRVRALERSGLTVSLTGPWPPYNFTA